MEDPEKIAQRVIAIGDIHGCLAAFQALLAAIEVRSHDQLVVLGDVIDRGPDSRGVLELIFELETRCELICLLGNHEQMLIDVIDGRMSLSQWLAFGGEETLDSYQQGGALNSFDERHLEAIRSWGNYYEIDSHFFAHGNYQPHIPLTQQAWHEMRWVSLREFTPEMHVSGKTAVVGHTSNKKGDVVNLGHLICLDTYCYGGQWLSALDVRSGDLWQANQEGDVERKSIRPPSGH